MSINATSSSVTSTSSSGQVSNSSGSDNTKNLSADSSFKEEMDKVTSDEKIEKNDAVEKKENIQPSENKNLKEQASNENVQELISQDTLEVQLQMQAQISGQNLKNQNNMLQGGIVQNANSTISMMDVNAMLSNDIAQMMNSATFPNLTYTEDVSGKTTGMLSLDFSTNLTMDSSDAEFFVNLTQKNDVSISNIVSQAQIMINQGADVKEVKQNIQISQALLDALSKSRETNQPLRIDFGQDISIILKIGKDGAIAANFIPGDKAVEQYLRNNIQSLKATFDENDLPYSDLSYSNRGSKQQKENRKNNDK